MKINQLKKIIKEVINEQGPILLQEQTGVPSYACSQTQMLNSFVQYTVSNGSLNWHDLKQCFPNVRSWLINLFRGNTMQSPVFGLYCPFNSNPINTNAPNQPCQFIQGRINTLTTQISNWTGNPNSQQLAQKQCKLDIFTAMLPWAQSEWNQPGSTTGC